MNDKKVVMTSLEKVLGTWSTVRDELSGVVKEAVDMADADIKWYEIDDCGDCFEVYFESEDDGEESVIVTVERAGSSWFLADAR